MPVAPPRSPRTRAIGGLAVVAACALLCAWRPPAASAGLRPIAVGGTIAAGYDTNLLGASRQELAAFGSSDPNYWFAVDRTRDFQGTAGIWGRWEVPSFYRTLRLQPGYTRVEALHNSILGQGDWSLDLRQKLPARSQLSLSADFAPQVYLRHRLDKNASPGEPRFRPEAYRSASWKASLATQVGGVRLAPFADGETRRETPWFRFRDESRRGVGLAVQVPLSGTLELVPGYEYGSCRARSHPYVGVDRSYHENAVGLEVHTNLRLPGGPWRLNGTGRLRFRHYTTLDPLDTGRFGRRDRLYLWSGGISHPAERIAPFVYLETTGRRVHLPAGASASFDENDYSGTVVRAGIEWMINRGK